MESPILIILISLGLFSLGLIVGWSVGKYREQQKTFHLAKKYGFGYYNTADKTFVWGRKESVDN